MAELPDIGAMTPGRRYRIEFQDCCVSGHFEATFRNYDSDEDPYEAFFDTATIDSLWGGYRAYEITNEETTNDK
jgi:hypothetical protein